MIHGIAIDPTTRTIEPVDFPCGNHQALRDALHFVPGQYLDSVALTREDDKGRRLVMFLDDEGLYAPGQAFFSFDESVDRIYAGRALMVACDAHGETIAIPRRDELLDLVRMKVTWRDVEFEGVKVAEGTVEHPILGPLTTITGTAQFRPKRDGAS